MSLSTYDRYYTSEAFGVKGLTFKGFKIDDIFTPGSNPNEAPTNTWELLQFHIKHTILLVTYWIIETWRGTSLWIKQILIAIYRGLEGRPLDAKPFELSAQPTADEITSASLLNSGPVTLKSPPTHVAVILNYIPWIRAPPPPIPQPRHKLDGTLVVPNQHEIGRAVTVRQDYMHQQELYDSKELDRLTQEISDLITWTALAKIPLLSIYERTGLVANHQSKLVPAIEQKLDPYFASQPEQKPMIEIICPSTQSCITISKPFNGQGMSQLQTASQSPPALGSLKILLLQEADGKQQIIKAARTIAEKVHDCELDASSVTPPYVKLVAQASPLISGEPDMLIMFGDSAILDGYPPIGLQQTYF